MHLDPSTISTQDAYKFLIGAIVPRPIAWVSTISAAGVSNLAPFSFFNAVCANPLTISFAPMRRTDGSKKDTLVNIEETGEFVVNVATEPLIEALNLSSATLAPEESEFAMTGLTSAPSRLVKPPRVSESPIQFECKATQIVTISDAPLGGSIVIGEVVALHIDERLYEQGRIDMHALQPIGRCAGLVYCRVTDTFELPRPDANYIGK